MELQNRSKCVADEIQDSFPDHCPQNACNFCPLLFAAGGTEAPAVKLPLLSAA